MTTVLLHLPQLQSIIYVVMILPIFYFPLLKLRVKRIPTTPIIKEPNPIPLDSVSSVESATIYS